MLRKDFILSPAQVYETRAAGADAVLLIAAALDDPPDTPSGCSLAELHALALELGLTPLVEVHARSELDRVLSLPSLRLVGINNRDLATFTVSLQTTAELRRSFRPACASCRSRAYSPRADVECLGALGVDAVLVGEGDWDADPGAKVRELSE